MLQSDINELVNQAKRVITLYHRFQHLLHVIRGRG